MENTRKGESSDSFGIVMAILAAFFISLELLVIEYLFSKSPEINSIEMIFWSYLGVVIGSGLYFFHSFTSRKRLYHTFMGNKEMLFRDSLLSIFGVCTYFIGIAMIGADGSAIFGKTAIFFSIMLGMIFLKEKVHFGDVIFLLLMSIGFFLYQEDSNISSWFGAGIVIFSNFIYVLINFGYRKNKNIASPIFYSYIRQILILIYLSVFVIILVIMKYELTFIGKINFLILTLGSVCGGIFSRACILLSLKNIELYKYSMLKNIDMFFVFIGSYLLFSHEYSIREILGVMIVFIAVIGISKSTQNKAKK